MSNLQQNVGRLIDRQTATWEMVRENYAALRKLRSRRVDFDGFRLTVQLNPQRIRSTTAPVESAVARPCFLCAANRPSGQESLRWREYEILVNPYPILDPHLTIPATEHTPQFLTGRLRDLVDLSAEMPGYVLLFNGAGSGASAPNHFHFQAVARCVLPVQRELPAWPRRSWLYRDAELSVFGVDGYLRPALVVAGTTKTGTVRMAETLFARLGRAMNEPGEAQVNAVAWADGGGYTVVFFPRTARRPRQYYAEGEERFLFSPGVIDLSGLLITIRPEDYRRASAPLIADLIGQVVPDPPQWEAIKAGLKESLYT